MRVNSHCNDSGILLLSSTIDIFPVAAQQREHPSPHQQAGADESSPIIRKYSRLDESQPSRKHDSKRTDTRRNLQFTQHAQPDPDMPPLYDSEDEGLEEEQAGVVSGNDDTTTHSSRPPPPLHPNYGAYHEVCTPEAGLAGDVIKEVVKMVSLRQGMHESFLFWQSSFIMHFLLFYT